MEFMENHLLLKVFVEESFVFRQSPKNFSPKTRRGRQQITVIHNKASSQLNHNKKRMKLSDLSKTLAYISENIAVGQLSSPGSSIEEDMWGNGPGPMSLLVSRSNIAVWTVRRQTLWIKADPRAVWCLKLNSPTYRRLLSSARPSHTS